MALVRKTLTFSINQEDAVEYVRTAGTIGLEKLIEEIKQRNDILGKQAERALNKKYHKKIAKGYLHCPVYYSVDEIAKKQLQELIYQHGPEEIVRRISQTA